MSVQTDNAFFTDGCSLDSVIATDEIDQRASRRADVSEESRTLILLTHELSRHPDAFFQTLVEAALKLTGAGSAGISLLSEDGKRFIWPAVAGGLAPFLGEGTPSEFGPCGTVLERDTPLLFIHPERHYTYLEPIRPALEEVLLVPFYQNGKSVGTVWAVMHDTVRKFDSEDRRLLQSLSEFAAQAYKVLSANGAITPLLRYPYPAKA